MPKTYDRNVMTITYTYNDVQNSQYGIYAYRHKDGKVLYIGKDKNINMPHRRHIDHLAPSKVKEQAVNQYLQKNLEKDFISFEVLALCNTEDEMNNLEIMYIMFYKSLGECKLNKSIDIKKKAFDSICENIPNLINELKFNSK